MSNIVLLEFVTTNFTLEYYVQRDLQKVRGDICVGFEFLEYPEVTICEQDNIKLNRTEDCADYSNKRCGKSCMFALTATQCVDARASFDLSIGVYKKMRPCMRPERIEIGKLILPLNKLFTKVMKLVYAHPEEVGEESLQDVYKLMDKDDVCVGDIGIKVKLSMYGQNIISKYTIDMDTKCVNFIENLDNE